MKLDVNATPYQPSVKSHKFRVSVAVSFRALLIGLACLGLLTGLTGLSLVFVGFVINHTLLFLLIGISMSIVCAVFFWILSIVGRRADEYIEKYRYMNSRGTSAQVPVSKEELGIGKPAGLESCVVSKEA